MSRTVSIWALLIAMVLVVTVAQRLLLGTPAVVGFALLVGLGMASGPMAAWIAARLQARTWRRYHGDYRLAR